MNKQIEELAKPFPAEDIEWRVGATNKDKTKGIALAYITARAVMNRLDEVLGPENWQDEYSAIPGTGNDTKGYLCTISIRLGNEWITKQDGADESNMESIKGGISDAFKRTAVKWGVGRYLYNLPNVWVPLESYGSSVKLASTPNLPAWALPNGSKKASSQNEKVNVYEAYVYPEGVVRPKPAAQAEADNDHAIYISMIREGLVVAMEKRQGRGVTDKANKFAHILLQQAVPDQDARHDFCKELFQVDNWSDVPSEEVGGFLDWLSPEKQDLPNGKISYKLPAEVAGLISKATSR